MPPDILLADTRKEEITTVLEASGLTRQLTSIADIIYSNIIVDSSRVDGCAKIARNFINDAVQPDLIVENIQSHLETVLSTDELNQLLEWYGSAAGKRIRQKEDNVSSEWRGVNVTSKMQSLIEAIAATVNATKISVKLQVIIEFSAYQLKSKGDMRHITFDQFISSDRIVQMEKDTHPYILSSYIQSYSQLEPLDLDSYLKFLRDDVTRKFYRETVNVLTDSLKNQIDKIPANLLSECE